jgi:hypothetical protein
MGSKTNNKRNEDDPALAPKKAPAPAPKPVGIPKSTTTVPTAQGKTAPRGPKKAAPAGGVNEANKENIADMVAALQGETVGSVVMAALTFPARIKELEQQQQKPSAVAAASNEELDEDANNSHPGDDNDGQCNEDSIQQILTLVEAMLAADPKKRNLCQIPEQRATARNLIMKMKTKMKTVSRHHCNV